MPVDRLAMWGLLAGFSLLSVAALLVMRWPRLRAAGAAAAFMAVPPAVYYALFLIWPDVLGPVGTMRYSLMLRYQTLFIVTLGLGIAVNAARWKR